MVLEVEFLEMLQTRCVKRQGGYMKATAFLTIEGSPKVIMI